MRSPKRGHRFNPILSIASWKKNGVLSSMVSAHQLNKQADSQATLRMADEMYGALGTPYPARRKIVVSIEQHSPLGVADPSV
jgi:hypothetical protein